MPRLVCLDRSAMIVSWRMMDDDHQIWDPKMRGGGDNDEEEAVRHAVLVPSVHPQ